MSTAFDVSFTADPRAAGYAPPAMAGRVDRISLVLWRTGIDDPEPKFTAVGFEDVRTLIAVWPTTDDGILAEGDPHVVWWTLPRPWFEQLKSRHRDWHLGRHDLLVSDRELQPCRDSLWRRAKAAGHRSAGVISAAVAALAPRENGGWS